MSQLAPGSAENRSCVPSGDQLGLASSNELFVSRLSPVPSTLIAYRSVCSPLNRAKAIRVPSSAQSAADSFGAVEVSLCSAVPSELTLKGAHPPRELLNATLGPFWRAPALPVRTLAAAIATARPMITRARTRRA